MYLKLGKKQTKNVSKLQTISVQKTRRFEPGNYGRKMALIIICSIAPKMADADGQQDAASTYAASNGRW